MRNNLVLGLIGALAVLPTSENAGATRQIPRSNDIRVVANPETPKFGEFRLELEKDLEIKGAGDGRDFKGLRDIAVGADGAIFLTDYMGGGLHIFDRQGVLKKTISSFGDEPKDFKPYRLGLNDETGDVAVWMYKTLKEFDREGRRLRDFQFPDPLGQDGLVIPGFGYRAIFEGWLDSATVHRLARFEATHLPPKILMEAPYTIYRRKEGRMETALYHSFAFKILLAQRGPRNYVVGYSREYRLEIRDEHDRPVLQITKEGPPPSFSKNELRRLKDLICQEHKPYFYRLLSDDRNRIYAVIDDPVEAASRLRCDVFGKDGGYLYRSEIPRGTRVIKGGYLFALASDGPDDDWTAFMRYRIKNWDRILEAEHSLPFIQEVWR